MTTIQDTDFITLKTKLAEMTNLTVEMIDLSIKALVERDNSCAEKVIEMDREVNRLDIEIDEICIRLLALFEPKAIDLRMVITVVRIINDLERIGDHCSDNAKRTITVNSYPQLKKYIDIPNMAKASVDMINSAMNAFYNMDSNGALEILEQDDYVDQTNTQIIRELFTYFTEDPTKSQAIVALIKIAESLERVADHATNIAEMVYYMVEGKLIRHKKIEDIKQK